MSDTSVDALKQDGVCCLKAVFRPEEVAHFRDQVLQNLDQMGRTRRTAHSHHLAGFHRFPTFAQLHTDLATHPTVTAFLSQVFDQDPYLSIGLSDITVNRSQHWHTDLLRGPYAQHLAGIDPWAPTVGPCIKVLLYLQPGKSLRIVRGSHLSPTPLDDAALERLAQSEAVDRLDLESGDVVMMDLRALHRGSTEEEMAAAAGGARSKILISTVFAPLSSPLSQAIQVGNAHRMVDWDRRHLL